MLKAAKNCKNFLNHFFYTVWAKPLPEPKKLLVIDEKLKKMANNKIFEVNNLELDTLLKKVNSTTEYDINLNFREINNLPFLLPLIKDDEIRDNVLKYISTRTSNSILKREILVYLTNYGAEKYIVDLRKDIDNKLNLYHGKSMFLKKMVKHQYLFKYNNGVDIKKYCKEFGFWGYLKELEFSDLLLSSNFVMSVLLLLFDNNSKTLVLDEKIDLFLRLYEENTTKQSFQRVLPKIISNLIIEIDSATTNREDYIEKVRANIVEYMGDPRISLAINSKWFQVDSIAKKIFIKWISLYDLDLFFNVIDKSLFAANAKYMWKYRRAFWSSYKENISMIWVCFGYNAKLLMRSSKENNDFKKLHHGNFMPNNKSCLLIEIGNYIFVERSHEGRLKVWNKSSCPFYIGQMNITDDDLNNEYGMFVDGVDGWVHSSSNTFFWQKKVGAFIAKYCCIKKELSDWQP